MKFLGAASLLFFSGVLLVAASEDGMDMSMDGSMSLASGNMIPYLHFTPGDVLWFQGWVPKSPGAMFGACFGLFLLAIVERWIAAIRSLAEAYWRKRCLATPSEDSEKPVKSSTPARPSGTGILGSRTALPFIPAHDISRGLLHMGQTAFGFAFMLAVMTFQVGFIFSIILGLGVGEMLFGRYITKGVSH
ncbi:hypothetical protein K443DRAFT_127524 [Laccaria amethystina LaAM-08-1]|uniref:Copper transport protein n=1 Tax=Laccaria amethystina LaAM-08-1 TaxID=1095629 RepID=A0A0C9XXC8_9AGAR|nr:hypothetical protein K443DRAFT_127524 [Laccaria amethystina LaAM-08-1]